MKTSILPETETTQQPTSDDTPIVVKFWGTRGSIATPGPATSKYGGNTSCVEVRVGPSILVLDCGTGARELGLAMAREFKGQPVDIHIFVSHTHWDHIQGFPFFVPAYIPGNRISIYSLRGTDKSLEKVFTGQMDSSYFPVELSDLRADLKFVELVGPQQVGPAIVNHIYLNHPGLAVGYRIQVGKKSVLYVTDHEPYSLLKGESDHSLKKDREIDDFAKGADLYIREAQYTDEEYPSKRSWGHATWSNVLEAAHSSRVKKLALFHHDPMHDDEFMDQVVAACQARIRERNMKFECFAASDSLEIRL